MENLKTSTRTKEVFVKFNISCKEAIKACKELTDATLALKKSNLVKHKSRYHS